MSLFKSFFKSKKADNSKADIDIQILSQGWSQYVGASMAGGIDDSQKPQLLLCCRNYRMAEALLTRRPSSTESFLRKPPSLLEFNDGKTAVCFNLDNRYNFSKFVNEIFKGDYGDSNVEVLGGLIADAPNDQIKHIMNLFGAQQGLSFEDVTTW